MFTFKRTLALLNKEQYYSFFKNIFFVLVLNFFDVLSISFLMYFINHIYQIATNPNIDLLLHGLSKNRYIGYLSIGVLLLFITKNMLAANLYQHYIGYIFNVAQKFAEKQVELYFNDGFKNHIKNVSGKSLQHILHSSTDFAYNVLLSYIVLISEIIMLLFILTGIVLYDAKIFLLLAATLLPCFLVIRILTKKKLQSIRGGIKLNYTLSAQYLLDAIKSYTDSKMYQREHYFTQKFNVVKKNINNQQAEMMTLQALPSKFMEIFAVLGVLVIIVYLSIGNQINQNSFLMIGIFIAASFKAIPSFNRIITSKNNIKTHEFTIDVLVKSTQNSYPKKTEIYSQQIINSIELNGIYFSYPNEEPILKNINLAIKKGKMIGIKGVSGSGKSTLLHILIGFLEGAEGRVLINNKFLSNKEDFEHWQQNIANVKQSVFLIKGTIAENITLNNSSINETQLKYAIDKAGLGKYIEKLPNGIFTEIEEDGKDISGGERQRIALARAIYYNRQVLIFDESFNELDEENIFSIMQNIKQIVLQNNFCLIVSHQPTVLKYCDEVYEILNGTLQQIN